MIEPGNTVFPNNFIAIIAARIPAAIDSELQVVKRPIRNTDGGLNGQAVAVFPLNRTDDRESIEIWSTQPTLNRYPFVIQSLVKHTNEEDGISIHSILSASLWNMFYRDNPLHTGLTALSVVTDNAIERVQRRGITLQRYLSNEIQGNFMFTSWIEAWIETEIVND